MASRSVLALSRTFGADLRTHIDFEHAKFRTIAILGLAQSSALAVVLVTTSECWLLYSLIYAMFFELRIPLQKPLIHFEITYCFNTLSSKQTGIVDRTLAEYRTMHQ